VVDWLGRIVIINSTFSRLQKIPVILDNRIFSKLFNIASVSNLTKEDVMKYEKDLMAEWDEYAYQKTRNEQEKAISEREKALTIGS